jgi:hypothetical protein
MPEKQAAVEYTHDDRYPSHAGSEHFSDKTLAFASHLYAAISDCWMLPNRK